MENITMDRKGNKLTITIDLSAKGKPSSTGKSDIIATSGGNQQVPGDGGFKLGLNLYRPK